MARLFIFLFVAHIAFAAVALISCLTPEKQQIRTLPRLVWIPLILFVPLLGPAAYFWAGRPAPAGPGPTIERPRPVAPDDNAEFLRSLEADQARQDREMFQRWEEDLRRREGDLRRQADDPQQAGDPQQTGDRRQAGDPPRGETAPES